MAAGARVLTPRGRKLTGNTAESTSGREQAAKINFDPIRACFVRMFSFLGGWPRPERLPWKGIANSIASISPDMLRLRGGSAPFEADVRGLWRSEAGADTTFCRERKLNRKESAIRSRF